MSNIIQDYRFCSQALKFTFVSAYKCKNSKMSDKSYITIKQTVETISTEVQDTSLKRMYVALNLFSRA